MATWLDHYLTKTTMCEHLFAFANAAIVLPKTFGDEQLNTQQRLYNWANLDYLDQDRKGWSKSDKVMKSEMEAKF